MFRITRSLSVLLSAILVFGCGAPPEEDVGVAEAPEITMADVELIPREALFGNPERFRGRISPDGSMISFLAPVDGVQNVWVAPTTDIAAARAVTNDTLRGIRLYYWATDGEHILYLQDQGGDENWQLHAVEVATAADRNLTPIDGVQTQILATSYEHPNQVLIGLNDRDERWHDVYRLDLETGEKELIEKNEGMAQYVADTALNLRLAVENTPDGGSKIYRRAETGAWEALSSIPAEDALTTYFQAVASDGRTAFGVDSRGRDTAALVALDIPTGEITVLGSDESADVQELLVHPETGEALAYGVNFQRLEWRPIAEEVAADLELMESTMQGDAYVLGQTQANDKWILYSDQPDAPGQYYLFDRDSNDIRLLFNTRPVLDDYRLAPSYARVIPTRDGLEVVSYLTLPVWHDPDQNGVPASPIPLVLLVHGGPWGRDVYGYDGEVQMLANRGYGVLQVNFRGSTGFGKEFVNAGDLEWGRAMHDDLIDAVDWAVAKGIAREDKVAIMGGSYGGYATLAGLTFTPEKFAAGVDIVGPSNLETLLASIPPYWTSMQEIFARRVGDPNTEAGQALLRERSPLYAVDKIRRPLLIGQGANDPRVKQAESDQIVEAMEERDLPVIYVLFPDEGHGFVRPENSSSFYAVTDAFLAGHLEGRFESIDEHDLAGSSIQVPEGADLIPGLVRALEALSEKDPGS